MLPILMTIGNGLMWFAATAGQLIFWGCGICIGYWVGKKITNSWDAIGHKKLAFKLFQKHSSEDELAAAVAATTAAQTH